MRGVRALVVALALLSLFAGPTASVALGHAQLVSSSPGAGEILTDAPPEVRLAFSEPIDGRVAVLDLLDADGAVIGPSIGRPDATDEHVLVGQLGALGDGAYTLTWRVLSAADGHTTSGFFTFGVGEGAVVGDEPLAPADSGGHGHPTTEVEVRLLGSLGLMLATGLALFAALVLRPVTRRWPRRLAIVQAIALGVGGLGAILVAIVAGGAAGLDPGAHLGGTRTGVLLAGRAALGLGGALVVAIVVRLGRPGMAIGLGGGLGAVALVLVALGGHAAAYASPAPVAVMVVHLLATSTWLGGVVGIADLAVFSPRPRRIALRRLVPRFSALALVAVALIGLTGLYSAWLQTGQVIGAEGPYGFALRLKVFVFGAALALGAFNYVDGGRWRSWLGGLGRRVGLEAGLALGVVVLAGNLAAGSPPAIGRAIPIEPAGSSAVPAGGAGLSVQPGRPGPNRYWVVLETPPSADAIVELRLRRLDGAVGETRVVLRATDDARTFAADGGLLPADSRWDGSVVVHRADSLELGRSRFTFGLDAFSINEGRATSALDPAVVTALLLLAAALVAGGFLLAGGRVPRVEARSGRLALAGGGLISGALAIVLLLGGPRL